MSSTQSIMDNITSLGYQPDSELSFSNFLYNSNMTLEFDSAIYNSIIDNLSKVLNMSTEDLENFVNESTVIKVRGRNYREALTLISIITVFYGIIFISGIIGNLITCIVISRNKYMHTATNFYLFNLAISDLLLLLSGMPQEIYSLWHPRSYPFTAFVCIMESTLLETAANVTVLTITAFSVERYIAICHPFRQHSMSKLSRAIKFILAIWVTAFILALPQAMQFAVVADNGSTSCTLKNWFYGHVFAVSGCVFFVGPMTAICVLYVLIGIKLKKSKLLQGIKRYDRGISAQTRVIRMLVAVAVAFFLCWAPFHAQRLMAVYGSTVEKPSKLFKKVFPVLNHVSGVMYYLSTCINPLLYNIMSHKFRNAFKLTLARQCGLFRSYQTQNNNYYSALPRQNGSMRLNMSTLDQRTTVLQLNKRESDISLLQDSNANNSRRLSTRSGSMGNHYRCVSASSQSTLMTTLSKNDVYSTVANVTPSRNHHLANNYSSNYTNNRQNNIGSGTTIQESTNSYSNNSCSPSQNENEMQIASYDDNLDEIADCHRLKSVQRYQKATTDLTPTTRKQSSTNYLNNRQDNSLNEHYQQLPSFSTVTLSVCQPGKPTTVSVIVPSKNSKSSFLGSSVGFRKSFESHPNSMMALNNTGNQATLISSKFKERISDQNNQFDNGQKKSKNHQKQKNLNQNGKNNKRDYDYAVNDNNHNNNIVNDSNSGSGISSNLSSSCSYSSNSNCNETNKCDKFSSPSLINQHPKLNNDKLSDLCSKAFKTSKSEIKNDESDSNAKIENNLTNSNSFINNCTQDSLLNKLENKNISEPIGSSSSEQKSIKISTDNDSLINNQVNCTVVNDPEEEYVSANKDLGNCYNKYINKIQDNSLEHSSKINSKSHNDIKNTSNRDEIMKLKQNLSRKALLDSSDKINKININKI